MPELEDRLAELASAIAWPRTPAFSVPVPRRTAQVAWRRPLAIAAAAVIVAAAALLAYPPSRNAIAGWLNLHTVFQRTSSLPTLSPMPSGALGSRLGLGTPTTLAGSQQAVSWHIAVPTTLGRPDAVYDLAPPDGPSGGEVTLVYAMAPGVKTSAQTGVAVLVTEARGKVQENFFAKMLGPDATVESVTVSGHPGYWISGSPHEFVFVDGSGAYRTETFRLATNTLVIDDGGTIVRIEGDMTLDQALEIASSL